MKKFLVIICGIFMIFAAFAAGENIPTSKSYVDAEIATKQNKIAATDGAPQVLMNTGTAGEVGVKNIYNSTGEYVTQTDALIDAVTMNTAVQNAIDSEFQCVEYNPNDPTDCWLMDVRGETVTGQKTLPTGYTALEYIESTGTQYIDTGIVPDTYYSMELDFQPTKSQSNIFAGTRNASASSRAFTINSGYANRLFYVAFGNSGNNREIGYFDTNRHRVKLSRNGWVFDGVITSFEFNKFTSRTSVYLFACNDNNGVQLASSVKIYNAKMWNGDILVLNMLPARRDSDGEIGMYDMVSNTFFTNSGTDDFIPGPVVNLYLPSN